MTEVRKASAQSAHQQRHPELREHVTEGAQRLEIPGVAVGVLLGGEEDYVCYGVTSIANPLPVDEVTFFAIGSMTKTYTGTAIMVLVERGLLDLAAPVRRYIPGLRLQDEEVAANVTVLHLLNHTAGWAGDFFVDTGYGDDALARYVERLADTPQETPLGAHVSYNNAALSLAGRVIEVVTGLSYEAALQALVLDPLGLSEHLFFPWDVMLRRFAVGHRRVDQALQVAPWFEPRAWHPQGGGFASTVRDQLCYARFHLGNGSGVLQRNTLEQMRTPTTPAAAGGGGRSYGISWRLRDLDGVRTAAHGGGTAGHSTSIELVPERDFAITVLTNARHGGELNKELVTWALEVYLGLVEREPEPLLLSSEQLAGYAGSYAAYNSALQLTVEGVRLVAEFTTAPGLLAALLPAERERRSLPPFSLTMLPDDQFVVADGPYRGMRGALLRAADGRIAGIDLGGRVLLRRSP